MKHLLALSVFLVCLLPAQGAVGDPEAVVQFDLLPTDYPVSNIAMSEDGSQLIVLHDEAGVISIIDTETGTVKKEICSGKPCFALCRGGKAYVSSHGNRCISVYSIDSWEILDKIPVDSSNVFYLSAPQGEYFNNVIMAKCKSKSNYSDPMEVHLVDTANGKSKLVYPSHDDNFTVDYTGTTVIFSRNFSTGVCSYADYIQGMMSKSLKTAKLEISWNNVYMRQIGRTPFWTSSTLRHEQLSESLYSGIPLTPIGEVKGNFILPDQEGTYVYVMDDALFKVINPGVGASIIASRRVAIPKELQTLPYAYDGQAFFSYAVRLHGDVHVFLLKEPRGNSLTPALYHAVFRGIFTAAEKEGFIPEKVVAGTAVVCQVFTETVKDATIVNAPENAVITGEGALKWTPETPGTYAFKIRATVAGKSVFKRFAIEVVAKEPRKVAQ